MRARQIGVAIMTAVTGSVRWLMLGVRRGMLPSLRKRRLLIVVIAAVVMGGVVIGGWWISRPPEFVHPDIGVQVAHAAPGTTGCAACHVDPIPFTNCTDTGCHADVPIYITDTNIYIAHHDEPGAPLDCADCHETVANDARYVEVPTPGHSFCGTCHPRTHSSPP